MNDRLSTPEHATANGSESGKADVVAPEGGSFYRVLARKYRPKRFEDLVGQEPMVRTLANAFDMGRIAQGYMLTGVRGIGKTTTARLIARALNYSLSDRPTVHMPEMGEHCEAILESRHVDVMEMDAASHTSVENIREIIEQVRYRPVAARFKVYIIDEVHMLSKAAFNALLKTLEEPPPHVKFIFATTEIRKVPVTILSRCQRFDLRRVEVGVLMKHLARISELENVPAEEEALRMIARAAEGSVRDALSLLDQAMAYGGNAVRTEDVRTMLGLMDRNAVIDLFEAVMDGKADAALAMMAEQHALGADPAQVLVDLATFTHLVTRLRILGETGADESVYEEEKRRGLALAKRLSMPVLTRAWQMLLKGLDEVRGSATPLAAAEMILIRLSHASTMPPPAELARRILEGEAGASPAPSGKQHGGTGSMGGATGTAPTRIDTGHASAYDAETAPETHPPADGTSNVAVAASASARIMVNAAEHETMPGHAAASATKRLAYVSERDPAQITSMPASMEEIAALARSQRDLKLKEDIERFVIPMAVSPPRLEIGLTEDAPVDLPGRLGKRLSQWTGQRWTVAVVEAHGGKTIHQQRQQKKASHMDQVKQHPTVQDILRVFPEARILDVRPPGETQSPTEGEEMN